MSSAPTAQGELFSLEAFEGYGELRRRERIFAEAIFEGCRGREAARRAGVKGTDQVLDVTASRLLRSVKVQRVLNQAWVKSGASIDATLRQAAELQQTAFNEATTAENEVQRAAAFRRWRDASMLIASIHGKLGLKIEGDLNLKGDLGITVPAAALPALAKARRDVVVERVGGMPAVPSGGGAN